MGDRRDIIPAHLLDPRRYWWDPDSICRLCRERISPEDFYVHGRTCPRCRRKNRLARQRSRTRRRNEGSS